MNKNELKKIIKIFEKSISKQPEDKNLKVLIRVLEIFMESKNIQLLHDDALIPFIELADFTNKTNIQELYPEKDWDIDITDLIEPLQHIFGLINDIAKNKKSDKMNFADLARRLDIETSIPSIEAAYSLDAKAMVTMLTKSDSTEIQDIFQNPSNILRMLPDIENILQALHKELVEIEQLEVYIMLYQCKEKSSHPEKLKTHMVDNRNHFSYNQANNFSNLQLFFCSLHAHEFKGTLQDISDYNLVGLPARQSRLQYFKFLLLLDMILERREDIDLETRKIALINVMNLAITQSAPKIHAFSTLFKPRNMIEMLIAVRESMTLQPLEHNENKKGPLR